MYICLDCGDFYPKEEIIQCICVWCSISQKVTLGGDGEHSSSDSTQRIKIAEADNE